ncbi:MAG: replication-relaxation family protein [Armatimonadetes bacterium]|nr:replication-relaxation family protein [Armatimonadota bacterium]
MASCRESQKPTRCELRARDLKILADLFLHRVMSRDQLIALGYFGSVPRCNNRLRKLQDHGYVRRYCHLARGSGSQALLSLGRSAAAIIANHLELPEEDVRLQAGRDAPTMFLEHTLGLVDLRILFGKAALNLELLAYDWLPEPLCRHEYSVRRGSAWIKCVVKPDAYVHWATAGETRAFMIEFDLGHVSQRAFQRKAQAYRRYHADGAFTEAYAHESFDVLTVTTSERRLGNLSMVAGTGGRPQFLFTTLSDLREKGAAGVIWTNGQRTVSLFGGAS